MKYDINIKKVFTRLEEYRVGELCCLDYLKRSLDLGEPVAGKVSI